MMASYTPRRAGYCDRSINPATIAKALVADPSAFVVRWSPIPGDEVVDTPFGLGV
jgi:hypothetical protein